MDGFLSPSLLSTSNDLITLMHEDIYVYVDKCIEKSEMKRGKSLFFEIDLRDQVDDYGVMNCKVLYSTFTSFKLNVNDKEVTKTIALSSDDVLILDFRKNVYKLNGKMIFLDEVPNFKDNTINKITCSFVGQGDMEVVYSHMQTVRNDNDLYFCTSLDYSYSSDKVKRNDINNITKDIGVAKREYSWSINGLWNKEEVEKFGELFNLRLIDEATNELNTLIGCSVNSFKNGSSDSGDLTYSLSGKFTKIM